MVSLAQTKDIPSLKQLWRQCFPDENEFYLEIFFHTIFERTRCYVVHKDSKVIAMAYAICDQVVERPAYSYIYAVAIDPDYRGLGLMRQIFDAIDDDNRDLNIDGQILVPSSDELEATYRRMGFSTFNKKCKFEAFCSPDSESVNWFVMPITSKDYADRRNEYLAHIPTMRWSDQYIDQYINLQRAYFTADYYQLFCADFEGIFFATIKDDKLCIKDMIIHPVNNNNTIGDAPMTLFSIMNAIALNTGATQFVFELNRVAPDMAYLMPVPDALIRYTNPLNPPKAGNIPPYFCLYLD